MINVYKWSSEIERNLVRIEFDFQIKKQILSHVQKFSGQVLPVKNADWTEIFVKFKNSKVAEDFLQSLHAEYPNSFHLENEWELSKKDDRIISFVAMHSSVGTIQVLSNVVSSLLHDCATISGIVNTELFNIQVSADETLCYVSFSVEFDTDIEATIFLKDFNKHHI